MRRLLFVLAVACGDNDRFAGGALRGEVALVPVDANVEIDVLFVLQASCCALEKQTLLKNAFERFVADLDSLPGGRPSLHIGVVSSDLGTTSANDTSPAPPLGTGPGACGERGDDGVLQKGTDTANTLVDGAFIIDDRNSDGSRTTNVTSGTPLATAIASLASLGASDCAYDQHLRAASVALTNPANLGFRRPSAALAIVIVAEDEDCSAASTAIFNPDADGTFRCFAHGVTCESGGATPDEMRMPGLKSDCHSNESSSLVAPVDSLVAALEQHVADPRLLMLAVIAGDPTPVEVILGAPPGGGAPTPRVRASCSVNESIAEPAVRLAEAAETVRRHVIASACAEDYIEPVAAIARQVRGLVGDTCLVAEILLPADCEVTDEHIDGTREIVPQCTTNHVRDCYELVEDASCASRQQLRVDVRRTVTPAPGTMVSVRCAQATPGKV